MDILRSLWGTLCGPRTLQGADVVLPTAHYPKHITCPYCPSQGYPKAVYGIASGQPVRLYVCPSKHKFYLHPEEIRAKKETV